MDLSPTRRGDVITGPPLILGGDPQNVPAKVSRELTIISGHLPGATPLILVGCPVFKGEVGRARDHECTERMGTEYGYHNRSSHLR